MSKKLIKLFLILIVIAFCIGTKNNVRAMNADVEIDRRVPIRCYKCDGWSMYNQNHDGRNGRTGPIIPGTPADRERVTADARATGGRNPERTWWCEDCGPGYNAGGRDINVQRSFGWFHSEEDRLAFQKIQGSFFYNYNARVMPVDVAEIDRRVLIRCYKCDGWSMYNQNHDGRNGRTGPIIPGTPADRERVAADARATGGRNPERTWWCEDCGPGDNAGGRDINVQKSFGWFDSEEACLAFQEMTINEYRSGGCIIF